MKDNNNTTGIMILFCTLLVLKLTRVIDWSWWWVTAPLWAGVAVIILILPVVLLLNRKRKNSGVRGVFK